MGFTFSHPVHRLTAIIPALRRHPLWRSQPLMRRSRIVVAAAAAALTVPTLAISTAGAATTGATTSSSSGAATSYVVLAKSGGSAEALARQLQGSGATVSSVNTDIGLVVVTS